MMHSFLYNFHRGGWNLRKAFAVEAAWALVPRYPIHLRSTAARRLLVTAIVGCGNPGPAMFF